MSEGDGGIQLNLSSGVSEKQPRKRQPSPDPEEQSGKKPKRVEASDEPEGRKGLSGGDAGGLRSDGTVVSSLFKHNPEIPQLNFDSEVRPVTEAVFTDRSFSEVGIHPHLVKNMADMGLASMTNVQSKAIPLVLASKDLLVKSQTGSGKTLAYAVPILHKLQEIRPKISRTDGTFVLVIVPTRELAIQSFEWFQKLCRSFAWIVPGVLLGGEKKKSEKARVRKGINVLISTPGRLIDHITHTKCLSLNKIKYLVLDEADRMLELGYERDVQTILSALNAVETRSGH